MEVGAGFGEVVEAQAEASGEAGEGEVRVVGREGVSGADQFIDAWQRLEEVEQFGRAFEDEAACELLFGLVEEAGELDGIAEALFGMDEECAAWLGGAGPGRGGEGVGEEGDCLVAEFVAWPAGLVVAQLEADGAVIEFGEWFAGVSEEGLGEEVPGGVELVIGAEGDGEVVVGEAEIGLESEGFATSGDRGGDVSLAFEDEAEVGVDFGEIWPGGEDEAEEGFGLGEFFLFEAGESDAGEEVELVELALVAELVGVGLEVALFGGGELIAVEEDVPEELGGLRVGGIEFEGLCEEGRGAGDVALELGEFSEIGDGGGVGGVELERGLPFGFGGGEVAEFFVGGGEVVAVVGGVGA